MKKILFLTVILFMSFVSVWAVYVQAENADASYSYYIPYFTEGSDNWTGVGLRNSSFSESANVSITVYNQGGNLEDSLNAALPPRGQNAYVVGAGTGQEGWIRVNSDQPLTGCCFFGVTGNESYMADITLISELSEQLHVPHIGQNYQWDSEIMVCNPNSYSSEITLIFRDKYGRALSPRTYDLPANGSGVYPVAELTGGSEYVNGSVEIYATRGVAAFALYNDLKWNRGKSYAGISAVNPASEPAETGDIYSYYLPYLIEGGNNWTGVGLRNSSVEENANVSIVAYDQNGNAAAPVEKELPPGGQDAVVVETGSGGEGWIRVDSSQPLTGLCFFGTTGENSHMADITFIRDLAKTLYVPHIGQNYQWDSKIMVCNPYESETVLTLTFVDKDGHALSPREYAIAPRGSGVYEVADMVGGSEYVNGSVEISATQGVAAFALYDDLKNGGSSFAGISAVAPTLEDSPDPSNHKPVAYPLSLATDMAIPYLERQLIATDTDGDRLSYELVAPSSGSGYSEAFISPSSGVLYVTLSDDGTDSITLPYHVSDGKIFSEPADITIEMTEMSADERVLGREAVDPRTYMGFATANFRSDLLGAPGENPTVPDSIDLSRNFPVPGDQLTQQSCVGWSIAYALKTYHEKVEMAWALNTSNHIFSPSFIYNQINGGRNVPVLISEGLNILINSGCCTWASMPYVADDWWSQPSNQAHQEALKFKDREWKRLSSTPSEIIAALVNRNPVIVGIDVYESFKNLSGSNSVYNTISGGPLGGHAVTIVGYDNRKYGGAFKVINSWGTNWGDDGYFWIPYNSANQIGMNEAYIVEDAENTISHDPDDDPIRPEPTGELPNLQVSNWSADYDPKPRGEGTLQWKVINTGNGTAPSGADVNFMLSKDRTLTSGDVYVIYEEISYDLEPGHAVFRDENNAIPFQFTDTLEDGIYHMAVWVDDLNEVRESDENDNIGWGSNQVTIENLLPDLEIQTWFAEWNDYGYGSLTYEVANNGKSAVSGTDWDINLVLSPDEEIGNGNEIFLFYEDGNYALDPGHMVYRDEASAASFYLYEDAIGRSVPDGTYYMAVWADDLNQVDESNELNNSSISWSVIEIGSNSRRLKEVTARNAYNGRRLPSPDTLMRKVQIKSTANGGRSLKFLDEEPVAPKIGEMTFLPPKTVSSKNHVIFPVVKEISMPEAVINNPKETPGSSESEKNTAGVPNPAAVKCSDDGYLLQPTLENSVPTDYFCVNPETGNKCKVWEYFRGECDME